MQHLAPDTIGTAVNITTDDVRVAHDVIAEIVADETKNDKIQDWFFV